MAEVLFDLAYEPIESQPTPHDYKPDKPRVIAPLHPESRREIDPLYDELGEYWNRIYRGLPGHQVATLCYPHEMYPFTPDAYVRRRMARSRILAINSVAEDRLQFVEVRTNGLIVNDHEGVPVISLSLVDDDTEIIRGTVKESITRTFSQLAEGGTVVKDSTGWLAKVHDLSLSYLPLARLPKGKQTAGRHCIERVEHLTPASLKISTAPKIYADLEAPLQQFDHPTTEMFDLSEPDMAVRAVQAALNYPDAEVMLAVSPDRKLGQLVLPDNIVLKFINDDAAYMRIKY